jgi:hypothetical protein
MERSKGREQGTGNEGTRERGNREQGNKPSLFHSFTVSQLLTSILAAVDALVVTVSQQIEAALEGSQGVVGKVQRLLLLGASPGIQAERGGLS